MKGHAYGRLALASVYTVCCPRRIVTLGERWHEQKQSLVSLSLPIHLTKPVCVLWWWVGGLGGVTPAQVSPECEFQVTRWVMPHSSLGGFSNAPGRAGGMKSSLKVALQFASDRSSLTNHPRPLKSPRDELHQQWVMAEKASRPVRGHSVNTVSKSLHFCATCSIPAGLRNCYEDNGSCCLWVCKKGGKGGGWVSDLLGGSNENSCWKGWKNEDVIRLKLGLQWIWEVFSSSPSLELLHGNLMLKKKLTLNRVQDDSIFLQTRFPSICWRSEGLAGAEKACLGLKQENQSPKKTMILSQNFWDTVQSKLDLSVPHSSELQLLRLSKLWKWQLSTGWQLWKIQYFPPYFHYYEFCLHPSASRWATICVAAWTSVTNVLFLSLVLMGMGIKTHKS